MDIIGTALKVMLDGGASARLGTKTISTNDTYDANDDNLDGYSSVTVAVQPNVDTKTITQNGVYNASVDSLDGYSSVNVEVAFESSSLENLTALGAENGYIVKPKGITPSYSIDVYVGVRLENSTDEDTKMGREFINGTNVNYSARPHFDIIDTATGNVVLTMATKNTYNQVVPNGYLKILSWDISSNGQILVNYTWENPSFTKPNIYTDRQGGANVTQYIAEWTTGPYIITYIPNP